MKIVDKVYGEHIIKDEVLKELIDSRPLQRLKGVYQGGASFLVNDKWNVTRYDHAIGVMLLIRRLGGSLEEQMAGLLHDISHTAFSHVIDFVIKAEESYHETIFKNVIEASEIPRVLLKYGYRYEDILVNNTRWTLLEQPLPDLCCDRIDYTLRDLLEYGKISSNEIHNFLDRLTIRNGIISTKDITAAEWFVKAYNQEVIGFFMDPLNLYAYYYLSSILKLALEKDIISKKDLLLTDSQVLHILQNCQDDDVLKLLKGLHGNVKLKENPQDYDFHMKNKLRIVDPLVEINNSLVRASEISNMINQINQEAYTISQNGRYVKIVSN